MKDAGENSAMPPKLEPQDFTKNHSIYFPDIPLFAENSVRSSSPSDPEPSDRSGPTFTRTSDRKGLRVTKLKPKRKKLASLPSLRKKAWAAFSRHVRFGEGKPVLACVSCGNLCRPEDMHAGHFIHCSRQSPLSYDRRNIHPQCPQCNYYGMQGEAMIHYTLFMQQTYGPGIIDELLAIKHAKDYLKRADLERVIAEYA